jgi:hypothetical protein
MIKKQMLKIQKEKNMGNLENVRIVCVGFDVTDEAKENIAIVFKKLLDEVPSDSFIEAKLTKVDNGIDGQIHVNSITGDFFSVQLDMTPQGLVDKLAKDLRMQLTDWRARRFVSTENHVTA